MYTLFIEKASGNEVREYPNENLAFKGFMRNRGNLMVSWLTLTDPNGNVIASGNYRDTYRSI